MKPIDENSVPKTIDHSESTSSRDLIAKDDPLHTNHLLERLDAIDKQLHDYQLTERLTGCEEYEANVRECLR